MIQTTNPEIRELLTMNRSHAIAVVFSSNNRLLEGLAPAASDEIKAARPRREFENAAVRASPDPNGSAASAHLDASHSDPRFPRNIRTLVLGSTDAGL